MKFYINRPLISVCILFCVLFLSVPSCTHDPIIGQDEEDNMEMDTMPGDTMKNDDMPGDTINENPCKDDVIYFEMQILPTLRSNCAFSGCHNAPTAQDEIILESYESVINSKIVTPFNLDESDLYEVLVEDKLEKRMPPSPADPLSSDQVSIIRDWILQGAENLMCEETTCNIESISFSNDINPIIETFCKGCHSGSFPSGGISLENYNTIIEVVNSGQLIGAVTWSDGFSRMPQNQDQLDNCNIDKIKAWINDGAKDN